MRKLLFVFAGAGLLLAVLAPVAIGDGSSGSRPDSTAISRPRRSPRPGVARSARGSRTTGIKFTLSYHESARGTQRRAHPLRAPRRGRRRLGVPVRRRWPAGVPGLRDHDHRHDRSGDVVGPSDQGIAAGEFAELVRAIRNGATYVNVHTAAWPKGEIRGNIRRD